MRRADQRREAVFALYQDEVVGGSNDTLADAKRYTRELVEGVRERREELDQVLAEHARDWALERIAPLERNIMRVALYEIAHRDDVPTEVAINEAVELAKAYSGADAPRFVNGVLGAAAKELA